MSWSSAARGQLVDLFGVEGERASESADGADAVEVGDGSGARSFISCRSTSRVSVTAARPRVALSAYIRWSASRSTAPACSRRRE